mmetsp:Transcript_91153/g.288800  ORF Transcript_91153/g.288800 Transcript_91153/m.288800 type:complete len:251 (-) Transcript_91153:78-830(-)
MQEALAPEEVLRHLLYPPPLLVNELLLFLEQVRLVLADVLAQPLHGRLRGTQELFAHRGVVGKLGVHDLQRVTPLGQPVLCLLTCHGLCLEGGRQNLLLMLQPPELLAELAHGNLHLRQGSGQNLELNTQVLHLAVAPVGRGREDPKDRLGGLAEHRLDSSNFSRRDGPLYVVRQQCLPKPITRQRGGSLREGAAHRRRGRGGAQRQGAGAQCPAYGGRRRQDVADLPHMRGLPWGRGVGAHRGSGARIA